MTTVNEAIEEAACVLDRWVSYYPEDMFPPGEASRDAISAHALRRVLPLIASDIRRLRRIRETSDRIISEKVD